MAGNERLAYEIAAIYTGSPEIKKAFADFAQLNAQGQRVVNQLDRMGQQAKKTGEEIRNSRTGAAQLGMQFNQLATQVAAGTSPLLAMQQQLGDVGYAMSFMGGTLGRIGGFLAGPWGAAIITATTVLSPFIAKLFETSDAAKEAEQSYYDFLNAARAGKRQELIQAEGQLTQMLDERMTILNKLDNADKVQGFNREFSLQQIPKLQKRLSELNTQIAWHQEAVNKGNATIENEYQARERTTRSITRQSGAMSSLNKAIEQTVDKYADLLSAKMKEYEQIGPSTFVQRLPEYMGGPLVAEFESVYNQINQMVAETYPSVMQAIKGPNEEMIKSFQAIGASVDDAFKGMLTAGMSWKDGMKGIINSVINELWRLYVTQQIVGMVSNAIGGLFGGGGIGGNTGGLEANFDKVFSGRAIGGSVSANTPYIVGERGPELFVPGGNGTIIPNKNMSNGGGAPNINVTVDARGSADPAAVREQVQRGILEAAPAIVAAAQQRTISTLRRPKLGGAMQ